MAVQSLDNEEQRRQGKRLGNDSPSEEAMFRMERRNFNERAAARLKVKNEQHVNDGKEQQDHKEEVANLRA